MAGQRSWSHPLKAPTPGGSLTVSGGSDVPYRGVLIHQGQDMWQLKAACRGPQAAVFFPPSHAERKEEKASREMRAKTICDQCRVRGDCLEYAIRIREPHGFWGGMNEMERKLMLDRRAS